MKGRFIVLLVRFIFFVFATIFFSQCVSPDLNTGINGSKKTAFGAADWSVKYAKVQPVAINNIQDEDGYINAQKSQKKRWDSNVKHDLYIAGHLYEAAVVHFRATQETRLLEAALRWADYQIREYYNENAYYQTTVLLDHFEYELGLLRLFCETGNKNYLEFSEILTNELCKVEGPTMSQVTAGGSQHAIRVGYLLLGMADLFLELGKESLIKHLEGLWNFI